MKRLAKWVDQGSRRTPGAALSLLRAQPGAGLSVPVPLRFVSRDAYERTIGNRDLNLRIARAPIEDVPIDSVVAIQHTVNRERVAQYIADPKLVRRGTRDPVHGGLVDLPIVVTKDGLNFLHDGHHRTSAEKYLGARILKVRHVDLDRDPRT